MPEISPSAWLTTAGWDDVPHLDADTKRDLLERTPPYLRDARSKGTPSLGAGAIYPIPESQITVSPFPIPPHWKRAYALDVGWNRTAALWEAWDPETGVGYLYSEYYAGQQVPSIHAEAIKARGKWIPGVIDPAARGRSQHDGQRLMETYEQLGLNLTKADNAVEAGLYDVWARLETGRLKVMSHLQSWLGEYRLYRRDEKGAVIKKNDHLMDDTRYLERSGMAVAVAKPADMGSSMQRAGGDSRMGY
ncbi:MAG TPA: hypothetical protein VD768_06245 [Sphingomicrobium sp.]|nr:hypothetical protein [Sphingomicrobium sp.]